MDPSASSVGVDDLSQGYLRRSVLNPQHTTISE
jgi:hypothetical protein